MSTSTRTTTPAPQPEPFLERHRQLAPTAAVRVSPLCLSTRVFNQDKTLNQVGASDILDRFYYLGGNFIDADHGQSARWVGDWMTARKNRDEIVLSSNYSNLWRPHETSKWKSNFCGNNTKSMKVALEASLANLQTTYIDIFYVAWWDHTTSIPELMHGLNDLVSAGKKGLRQFAVYCGLWGSRSRDIERDIVPMCVDEGMAICALHRNSYFVPDERQRTAPLQQHSNDVTAALQMVARTKGTNGNIEVAYIMGKAPYVFPVFTPTAVCHVEGMVASLGITLSERDIEHIEAAYKFDFGYPHTVLSGTMFTTEKSKGVDHPAENSRLNKLASFDWVSKLRAIGRKKD